MFRLQLALAVCRVGLRRVVFGDVGVGLVFVYGSEHAQRTDEHKPLQRYVQCEQRLHEVLRAEGVGTEEVVAV